ncbi:MAG: trypsin-like serine protease [Clostridiales bacterium]|nr:trypsin-like serine protease [Clostridiales bacterium]
MIYKYTSCPVCGSDHIKEEGYINELDNTFFVYRCLSCEERFNSKIKYIAEVKAQEAKKAKELKLEEKAFGLGSMVFENSKNSVIEIAAVTGDKTQLGTGIVITEDGYILTNAHTLFSCDDKTTLCDSFFGKIKEETFEADFIYADKESDIALLKTYEMDFKPVKFARDSVKTGDKIFAVGNSKGKGLCILEGLVSDSERVLKGQKYLMISALVTNGNSGGPVFNGKGEMVGMVAIGCGDSPAMNYAIPLNRLIEFIRYVEKQEDLEILEEMA